MVEELIEPLDSGGGIKTTRNMAVILRNMPPRTPKDRRLNACRMAITGFPLSVNAWTGNRSA